MSTSDSADAWTALLAHAMQLAKAARAWPSGDAGRRMRDSVVPWVQLQAAAIAMARLSEVPSPHRAHARDQADLLVARACEALRQAWAGEPMPDALLAAMGEARQAVSNALYAGLSGLRWPGPGSMVVPAWPETVGTPVGSLALMEPGTIVLPGEIVGWWAEREDLECAGCERIALDAPVQVYRRFDETGRFEGAATIPLHDALPAGMPMLVPLCVAGAPVGAFARDPAAWLAMQRAAGIPAACVS
jgi:hypothetical protein